MLISARSGRQVPAHAPPAPGPGAGPLGGGGKTWLDNWPCQGKALTQFRGEGALDCPGVRFVDLWSY